MIYATNIAPDRGAVNGSSAGQGLANKGPPAASPTRRGRKGSHDNRPYQSTNITRSVRLITLQFSSMEVGDRCLEYLVPPSANAVHCRVHTDMRRDAHALQLTPVSMPYIMATHGDANSPRQRDPGHVPVCALGGAAHKG